MTRPVKATVFGTGSWGTAFAIVLADAGCEVTLWGRRQEVVVPACTTISLKRGTTTTSMIVTAAMATVTRSPG